MKKFFWKVGVLLLVILISLVIYKAIGTSYCYIKTPDTKEEANKVIDFCSNGNLFFYDLYSESLANIFKKYPDKLQNENSASMLITYYIKNNPTQHLKQIENLTNVITEDTWNQEKRFLFVLEGGYFEDNLPLEFRRKTFNTIYEKYKNIIENDKTAEKAMKKMALQDMDFLHSKLNAN